MTHPQIPRENILDGIEGMFGDQVRIVVLEAPDEFGKTTVLRQLRSRHEHHSVAVFLSAASRYSYDPSMLLEEYCEQMRSLLPSSQHPDPGLPLKRRYHRLISELTRRARTSGDEFYFILDGLEEIPTQDRGTRDELFREVPFGALGIRCVLSGRASELPFTSSARKQLKTFPLTSFVPHEAEQFLGGLGLTAEDAKTLASSAKWVPGILASIRRLLEQGHAPSDILAGLHQRVPGLFAMEWSAVGADERRQLLLAVLSRDNRPCSPQLLASITGYAVADVRACLDGLRFLQVTELGEIRFVSESMRKAASEALGERRQHADDLVLGYLKRDPDSREALANLPAFFSSTERLAELVAYLSPERLARLYQTTPSLSQLRQHTHDAARAARELARNGDVVRLTLQQATLLHMADSRVAAAELRALTAMGDVDGAIAIAERTIRPIEKLRLLATIARARTELDLGVDAELRDRISAAYDDIDAEDIGEDAAEVAADLFCVYPDLAIEYVSKSRASAGGDEALDWAFASLAVRAQQDGAEEGRKRARDLRDRIQDPAAKRLSTQAVMLMGGLSAAEAIAEAERIERVADQVYVLRHWMLANAKREDAVQVLEHALKVILKSRSYAANAQVFRELALCLPNVPTPHTLQYWIDTLDAQRASIEKLGPYEEVIRLDLVIARALWKFDRIAASDRYTRVYDALAHIEDPASRVASTARLLTSLRRIDTQKELDEHMALHQLAESDLREGVSTVLDATASHFEAMRSVLGALAPVCPDEARRIAAVLNTEWRRNQAYAAIADAASGSALSLAPIPEIFACVASITDPEDQDAARGTALRNLRRRSRSEGVRLIEAVAEIARIQEPTLRARIGAEFIAAPEIRADAGAQSQLRALVLEAFLAVESDSEKLQVGYDVIGSAGPHDADLAKSVADEVNGLKLRLSLLDEETSRAAMLGIQLAIRAYAGLIARENASPNDLPRLRGAIERVGGLLDQAVLWTDLAERLWAHGRDAEATTIVADRIEPLVQASSNADESLRQKLALLTLPIMYVAFRGGFQRLLAQLPQTLRDEALFRVGWFVMRRIPTLDPYDNAVGAGYDLSWDRALLLVDLMKMMEEDNSIYGLIEAIVETLTSARYGDEFKSGQRDQLALELERIANSKFPAQKRFIAHQGYRIAARATLARLKDKKTAEVSLRALAADARQIPNLSDRAYVLSIIARASRDQKVRDRYIDEAIALAESIPLLFERCERMQEFSSMLWSVDNTKSRALLQKALHMTAGTSEGSVARRQRLIVEELYRRDPKTAPSVASVLNGDSERRRVEDREGLVKLKEALTDRRGDREAPRAKNVIDWSRVAWMALGELNAGRSHPLPPERTLAPMQHASVLSVADGYPIYAWAIENNVRHKGSGAREFLVPLFEACLAGAELALHAASRPGAAPIPRERKDALSISEAASVLIKDGERRSGLGIIREWLHDVRPERLWILDPYFTPSSLEALLLAHEAVAECEVFVLTAKAIHRRVASPYEDTYRTEWGRLSAQEPPPTTIILAGTIPGEKCPVHDRWWLTDSVGLKLGTSLNGVGGRWSDIERIDETTTQVRRTEFAPLFAQSLRQFEGERLTFSTIKL